MDRVKALFEVEGLEVAICDSKHSIERFHERFGDRNSELDIIACLMSMAEYIIDLKSGKEFAVVDPYKNLAIIGCVNSYELEISFDLITVVETNKFYVKKGTDTTVLNTTILVENQTA